MPALQVIAFVCVRETDSCCLIFVISHNLFHYIAYRQKPTINSFSEKLHEWFVYTKWFTNYSFPITV